MIDQSNIQISLDDNRMGPSGQSHEPSSLTPTDDVDDKCINLASLNSYACSEYKPCEKFLPEASLEKPGLLVVDPVVDSLLHKPNCLRCPGDSASVLPQYDCDKPGPLNIDETASQLSDRPVFSLESDVQKPGCLDSPMLEYTPENKPGTLGQVRTERW